MDIPEKRYPQLKCMLSNLPMIKIYRCLLVVFFLFFSYAIEAQTAEEILQKVKTKLEKVNDYVATGKMKTNVAFIKAPLSDVKIYYKKPDKLRIINENGISFIPKGS